jgi:hypothetical protein
VPMAMPIAALMRAVATWRRCPGHGQREHFGDGRHQHDDPPEIGDGRRRRRSRRNSRPVASTPHRKAEKATRASPAAPDAGLRRAVQGSAEDPACDDDADYRDQRRDDRRGQPPRRGIPRPAGEAAPNGSCCAPIRDCWHPFSFTRVFPTRGPVATARLITTANTHQ